MEFLKALLLELGVPYTFNASDKAVVDTTF